MDSYMTEDLALESIFHSYKDELENKFAYSTEVFEWMHTLNPTYNFLYSPLEFLIKERDDVTMEEGVVIYKNKLDMLEEVL